MEDDQHIVVDAVRVTPVVADEPPPPGIAPGEQPSPDAAPPLDADAGPNAPVPSTPAPEAPDAGPAPGCPDGDCGAPATPPAPDGGPTAEQTAGGGCAVAPTGGPTPHVLWLLLVFWGVGRWRRRALTAAAAVALLACGEADPSSATDGLSAALEGEGRTYEAILAAAERHGVPSQLMVAAAWSESRLRHRGGEKDGSGLFQLDAGALRRAARLLDLSAETVARDLEANAQGFAALVSDNAGRRPPEVDVTEWWLDAVSGVRTSDAAARAMVDGVRLALASGLEARLPDGHVRLSPSPYAALRRAARPDTDQAEWIRSPNYTDARRRPADVDTVVIHVTQGSFAGTISWFQSRQSRVSAHYTVRSSDGYVVQSVEEEDIAWHARSWNDRSIGIEHEGFIDDPAWFTDAMYRASARLTRGICERWDIPRNRRRILGHVELSGNDHTDPGRHWNWDRYMQLVEGAGEPEPECEPVGAAGRVVDDSDACFRKHGPSEYWRREDAGEGGGLWWTNGFASDEPSNWAEWRLDLEAGGAYEVAVRVVAPFNRSQVVPYAIRAAGVKHEVVLDQSASEGWRTLGVFDFDAGDGQWVRVFDNTGEEDDDRHITVDAIRLRPPPDAPVDAGAEASQDSGPPVEPDAASIPDAGDDPDATAERDARPPPSVGRGSPDATPGGKIPDEPDGGRAMEPATSGDGCECDAGGGSRGALGICLLLFGTSRRRRPR